MPKELADDWWNQNKNLVTGFYYCERNEISRDRLGSEVLKYEMEPISYRNKRTYEE